MCVYKCWTLKVFYVDDEILNKWWHKNFWKYFEKMEPKYCPGSPSMYYWPGQFLLGLSLPSVWISLQPKDYFNCLFHPSKVGNPSMWNGQGSRTFLSRWSDEIFPIGRVLCTLNCLLLLSCFPLWENNQEKNSTLLLISMDILCRLYCKGEKKDCGFCFFSVRHEWY